MTRSAAVARDFTIELEAASAGFAALRDGFATSLLVLMGMVALLLRFLHECREHAAGAWGGETTRDGGARLAGRRPGAVGLASLYVHHHSNLHFGFERSRPRSIGDQAARPSIALARCAAEPAAHTAQAVSYSGQSGTAGL